MAQPKKPVMDVAKPGKTPASATSRPIIVGHGTAIKDPMVNDDKPNESPETESLKSAHKVIAPLETTSTESKSPGDTKPSEEKESKSEEPAASEQSISDDAVVDAVIEQMGDKKQQDKADETDRKRQELVEKLVVEKKYFLPINSVQRRRNSRLATVLIASLLPLIIGIVLAIDAGVIFPEVTLPFDLIK